MTRLMSLEPRVLADTIFLNARDRKVFPGMFTIKESTYLNDTKRYPDHWSLHWQTNAGYMSILIKDTLWGMHI